MSGSVLTHDEAAAAPPVAASVPAESQASSAKVKSSHSLKKKKKSKHRSPSPVSSSSESDSSESSSSESEFESDSEPDTPKKKSKKKKKKGKYDASKFLDEGDKVDSFERLILANLRMAIKLLKKERNIKGLLQHLVMVTEKAEKGMFASDSLCKYDEAVRNIASEKGLHSFSKIDPNTIFKFLTYDGTLAAERAKRATETGRRQGRGRSGVLYACYAFNNASEGCKGNCGYRHNCSSCGAQNHIFGDCLVKKPPAGRGRHK